jgi:hypothetical protein
MPAPPSSDLPPWLRRSGPSDRRRANRSAAAAGGLALLVAGLAIGWVVGSQRSPAPAVAAPVCPPVPPPVACAEPARPAPRPATPRPSTPRTKPTRVALQPLPDAKPMDEGERTQALRTYAQEKAPELRDCLDDPDRGPPVKLGAAFEIAADGAVELVQILGTDGTGKDVRRCYSKRLKRWRFPQALLRGEEKLLVNFVL